ncbi:LysR substrate-binding domain-containing protein [Pseudomonas sp. MH2]|uniref:LysR substrate-binding domain-containing protein n=2 Tax=Pseudomonas TaxID=286 RepID=A0ABU5VAJ5_9PSED|nr:LysR substrate-binding domain-containing protein [Pseudomonas sp. MH2]MEA5669977.1 LysR substrate-binding domain-containing protein [Pseudomonas sp. MH2]
MLRINAAAFAAREIIGPLVLEFLRRYPQMQVDLVTEGRLVDIVADGFDLGVRVADLVPSDMISLSLGRPQRYAVVASAAYLAARGTPRLPADLQRHSCVRVRLPDGALFRWRFANGNSAQQIDVQGPITLDEASLARTAVMAGVGLGYFMEQDVREDIAAGRLVRVLDDWTPPLPGLCLYYAGRRNPSAGMTAFLALAREVAEQACREGT